MKRKVTVTDRARVEFDRIHKIRFDRIMLIAKITGQPLADCAVTYDLSLAPHQKLRMLLASIGFEAPSQFSVLNMGDDEVAECISQTIDHLAMWNVFVTDTDHLDDRRCLDRLLTVLNDAGPTLPPFNGAIEFIGLRSSLDGEGPRLSSRDDVSPGFGDVSGHGDYYNRDLTGVDSQLN